MLEHLMICDLAAVLGVIIDCIHSCFLCYYYCYDLSYNIIHRKIDPVDGVVLHRLCVIGVIRSHIGRSIVLNLPLAFFALLSPIPPLVADVSNGGSTLRCGMVEGFLVIIRIGRRRRRAAALLGHHGRALGAFLSKGFQPGRQFGALGARGLTTGRSDTQQAVDELFSFELCVFILNIK